MPPPQTAREYLDWATEGSEGKILGPVPVPKNGGPTPSTLTAKEYLEWATEKPQPGIFERAGKAIGDILAPTPETVTAPPPPPPVPLTVPDVLRGTRPSPEGPQTTEDVIRASGGMPEPLVPTQTSPTTVMDTLRRAREQLAPTPPAMPKISPEVKPLTQKTTLSPEDERAFQKWYAETEVAKYHMNPDPDAPQHYYDYRGAWKAGISRAPGPGGHWPDTWKMEGHPTQGTPDWPGSPAGRAMQPTAEEVAIQAGGVTAGAVPPPPPSPEVIGAIEKQKTDLEASRAALEAKAKGIEQLRSGLDEQAKSLQASKAELDALTSKATGARIALDAQEKLLASSRQEIESLIASRPKGFPPEEFQAAQQKINEYNAAQTNYQDQVKAFNSTWVVGSSAKITAHNAAVTKYQTQAKAFNDSITALKSQSDAFHAQVAAYNEGLKGLPPHPPPPSPAERFVMGAKEEARRSLLEPSEEWPKGNIIGATLEDITKGLGAPISIPLVALMASGAISERTAREIVNLLVASIPATFGPEAAAARGYGKLVFLPSVRAALTRLTPWERVVGGMSDAEEAGFRHTLSSLNQTVARGSTAGERTAASTVLDRVLSKYGLALEDLPADMRVKAEPLFRTPSGFLPERVGMVPEAPTVTEQVPTRGPAIVPEVMPPEVPTVRATVTPELTQVQYPSLVDTSAFAVGTPVSFDPDAVGTVSRILSPTSLVVRRDNGSEVVVTASRTIPFVKVGETPVAPPVTKAPPIPTPESVLALSRTDITDAESLRQAQATMEAGQAILAQLRTTEGREGSLRQREWTDALSQLDDAIARGREHQAEVTRAAQQRELAGEVPGGGPTATVAPTVSPPPPAAIPMPPVPRTPTDELRAMADMTKTIAAGPLPQKSFAELARQSDDLQEQIDALHDSYDQQGVPFREQGDKPDLKALYDEKIQYDTAAAIKGYRGARRVMEQELEGEIGDSMYASIDSILREHYSLTPEPMSGAYFMSQYTGKALEDPKIEGAVAYDITKLLFAKENPHADFWLTMESPMSGLAEKGKRKLIERGIEKAKIINRKISDFFAEGGPAGPEGVERRGIPVTPMSETPKGEGILPAEGAKAAMPEPVPAAPVKQAWEMTQREFVGDADQFDQGDAERARHRQFVWEAIQRGETIPPEVLAEYPELAEKPKGKAEVPAAPKRRLQPKDAQRDQAFALAQQKFREQFEDVPPGESAYISPQIRVKIGGKEHLINSGDVARSLGAVPGEEANRWKMGEAAPAKAQTAAKAAGGGVGGPEGGVTLATGLGGIQGVFRRRQIPRGATHVSPNPRVAAVLSGKQRAGLLGRLSSTLKDMGETLGEEFVFGWVLRKFPHHRNDFRLIKDAASDARILAGNDMVAVIGDLSKADYETFRQLWILRDLEETAQEGKTLPAPSIDQPPLELPEIQAEIARLEALASQQVMDALRREDAQNQEHAQTLIARGLLDPDQVKQHYAPHHVLDYTDGIQIPGLPRRLQKQWRGYTLERKGSPRAIDVDYFRVKWTHLVKYHLDNILDDFVWAKLREADETETIREAMLGRLQDMEHPQAEELAARWKPTPGERQQVGKQIYEGYQFERGRQFYPVTTIPEDMVDYLLSQSVDEGGRVGGVLLDPPGGREQTTIDETAKTRPTIGRHKKVYMIPVELASALKQFRQPIFSSLVSGILRTGMGLWKRTVLGFAGLPFQYGNFLGDLINLYKEDPAVGGPPLIANVAGILSGTFGGGALFGGAGAIVGGGIGGAVGAAGSLLSSRHMRRGAAAAFKKAFRKQMNDPQVQAWLDEAKEQRVVGGSTFYGAEVESLIQQHPELRRFLPLTSAIWQSRLNPVNVLDIISQAREESGRLAKFFADMERIGRGESVVVSGIDLRGLTPVEGAGKAAREFTVDYGATTPLYQKAIRGFLFPFATFYHGNFSGWANAFRRKPIKLSLLVLVPLFATWIWNNTLGKEQEEGLPLWYRFLPHINTMYKTEDGQDIIVALQTPLDMAAKMIGLDAMPWLAGQVYRGEKTVSAAGKELLVHMGQAPVEAHVALLTPLIKTLAELIYNREIRSLEKGRPIVPKGFEGSEEAFYMRLRHGLGQFFAPYAQYIRADRSDKLAEIENPFIRTLLLGFADVPRASGIRYYDPEKQRRGEGFARREDLLGDYADALEQGNYDRIQEISGQLRELGVGFTKGQLRDTIRQRQTWRQRSEQRRRELGRSP